MAYLPSNKGSGRARMLAATADRDRAVDVLQKAYADGRLTKDEYDTRLGKALSAATYGDLDTLVSDIPKPRPPAVPPARHTNGLAIASLVCGLFQIFLGPLPTIPAIVLGHVARSQIRRTGEDGAGLALAGLLLGWVVAALVALFVLLIVVSSVRYQSTRG